MTNTGPLEHARQLRAERKDLDQRIKAADETAVADGFNRGMTGAEIAAAIGSSYAHVYNVHRRSKGADQ